MPDYVSNNNLSGTSQLLRSTRYQVPGTKKEKIQGKKGNNRRKKLKVKQKQTCAQGAGRVPRGQGCCLPVVRSVLWCVQQMDNRRTTKKARRRTRQDEGRDKAEKNKSRPQRGGGFSLNLYLPGVSRWSCVISHDLSRYIVMSYPISCDITRYDISCLLYTSPSPRD